MISLSMQTPSDANRIASGQPTISAVIISCNEADVIEECLESVAGWVDEIVVVDMQSADDTRKIVQRYTNRLIDHEPLSFVEPARNFALSQASGSWIIMLDPDERVPQSLAKALQQVATKGEVDVVEIPRQQVQFGKIVQSPGASDGTHIRFFRRGAISWPCEVHGRPELTGLCCYKLPSGLPSLSLQHDTWRSVPIVLDKIRRYVSEDVRNLQAQGVTFSPRAMAAAARHQYMSRMLDGRAYEDGMAGLLTALYFSIYHLSIYAHLWEIEGRTSRFDKQIQLWGNRFAQLYWFYQRTKLVVYAFSHPHRISRTLLARAMGRA